MEMRNVRNLALASGAAVALALGGLASAQETKQPAQEHGHAGDAEHEKNHAGHMQRMDKMHGEMHDEMHKKHEKRETGKKHEHSPQEQAPR